MVAAFCLFIQKCPINFALPGRNVNSLNWRWRQKHNNKIFSGGKTEYIVTIACVIGRSRMKGERVVTNLLPYGPEKPRWEPEIPANKLKNAGKYNDAFDCRRFFSQSGHAEAGQHPRGGDLLGAAQGRLHQIRSVRQSSNIQNWDILTKLHR